MACGFESDNFEAGPLASILDDTLMLVVTLTTFTFPFALKIARLSRE